MDQDPIILFLQIKKDWHKISIKIFFKNTFIFYFYNLNKRLKYILHQINKKFKKVQFDVLLGKINNGKKLTFNSKIFGLKFFENFTIYLKIWNNFNFNKKFLNLKTMNFFLSFDFFILKKLYYYTDVSVDPCVHPKDEIWNDFLKIIFFVSNFEKFNIFFEETMSMITILIDSIWALDGQYEKFLKRNVHGGKIIFPPVLLVSFFASKNYRFLWNIKYGIGKKIVRCKILTNSVLREYSQSLKIFPNFVNFTKISNVLSRHFIFDMLTLSSSLGSYADYNRISLKRIIKNHSRILSRDLDINIKLRTIEAGKINRQQYFPFIDFFKSFLENLENLKNYQVLYINSFLPLDRHARRKFLCKLKFNFPVELLEFFPGGNKRKILKCWKVPYLKNQRSKMKTNNIIRVEKTQFPIFFSRKMQKNRKK
jgi:hypothetical protein